MATKLPYDENIKVVWATSVASIAAPTVAEIGAGTDITCLLTKDGLTFGVTTASIDASTLCSRFMHSEPGSVDVKPVIKGYRFTSTDDDLWDLVDWGDAGYLIVRPMVPYGTAVAAAQKVIVIAGKWGEPEPAPTAANSMQTFSANLNTSDVNLKAAVAA